jgi:hypothetical protein
MGNEFRVVCGTGQSTSYKAFNSEKDARDYAGNEILRGTVSQVVVERNNGGQWEPVETHKHRH